MFNLDQNSNQGLQQGLDRISSLLQERSAPKTSDFGMESQSLGIAPNISQILLSQAMLGNKSYGDVAQDYVSTQRKNQMEDANSMLAVLKEQAALGDKESKDFHDVLEMVVGKDPMKQVQIIQELDQNPDFHSLSNPNRTQMLTFGAGAAKKLGLSNTDFEMAQRKAELANQEMEAKIGLYNAKSEFATSRVGSDNENNTTNLGKPPSGYRFKDDGTLEPIPGGPGEKISSELAGRLGLGLKFLQESPEIKKEIQSGKVTGLIDYNIGALGYGDSGKTQRRLSDGADSLQRMLTGAGMPASEAADYANRFRATYMDNSSTLLDKTENLETILNNIVQVATRGHGNILDSLPQVSGGKMHELPDPAQHSGRTITNTDTGQKYKSNGSEWIPQ